MDDGARDVAASRAGLAAMLDAQVHHLTATPHFNASLTLEPAAAAARFDALDQGWTELSALAREGFPGLALSRGAEVMLDAPRPDLSDPRLRLGGGAFVLVEFAYHAVPPESVAALAYLREKGWTPLLAHPERHADVWTRPTLLSEWRRAGAYFQINAGSLTGSYGRRPRQLAHDLLARGWADVLASDYHGEGEVPLAGAWDLLTRLGGERQAELLMSVNPQRLLRDAAPLPVEPLKLRLGLWERAKALFT